VFSKISAGLARHHLQLPPIRLLPHAPFLRNRKYSTKSRRELLAAARASAFSSAALLIGGDVRLASFPGHFAALSSTFTAPSLINHLQKREENVSRVIH
jgi:hypothetical protein